MAEDVQLLENRLKLLKMEEKKVTTFHSKWANRLGKRLRKQRRKHERLLKTNRGRWRCRSKRSISKNRKSKR